MITPLKQHWKDKMSVKTISPQEIRNGVNSIAAWYEQDSPHNARCNAGALIPFLPQGYNYLRNAVNEIVEAERITWVYSTRVKGDEEGGDRKPKRVAVRKLPELLERHCQVLLTCNKQETEKVFQRAKAHALRALAPGKPGLTTMSLPVNRHLFSFMPTQDLASLSETNLELNFQLKTQHPILWQNLGKSYCLPQDYWPNFSKQQCLQNFGLIHRANQALDSYTRRYPGDPMVLLLVSLSGRQKASDLDCTISDPQRRFVEYTHKLISPMLKEGQPVALSALGVLQAHPLIQKGHFLDLLNGFAAGRPKQPREFLNLVWTCGFPKHLVVIRTMLDNIYSNSKIQTWPEVLDAWIAAFEWGLRSIPQVDEPTFEDFFSWIRTFHTQGLSHVAAKLEPLIFQILQRGVATPKTALYCHGLSANLFKALLISYQPPEGDRSLRNVLGSFLMHHMGQQFYKPEEILGILNCFPVELSRFTEEAELAQLYTYPSMPSWLYFAAMTGGRGLLRALRNLGVRNYFARSLDARLVEYNTLDIALENSAPLALIALLVEEGVARISRKTQSLLDLYPNSPGKHKLRELLFGPGGPPAV